MALRDDIASVLIPEQELQDGVTGLADKINEAYTDADHPLLVCVLKGAFVFLADLTRRLEMRHEVDFMEVSSYGAGTESTGIVRILLDLEQSIEGRHVLIVEDIVDSGLSVSYLKKRIESMKPSSVKFVSLLVKKDCAVVPLTVDYIGFEIENKFVIGYGLDLAQKKRNLNSIYQIIET